MSEERGGISGRIYPGAIGVVMSPHATSRAFVGTEPDGEVSGGGGGEAVRGERASR